MKILKYTGIALVALVLLYIGLCAIGPSNFNIVEETEIKAPPRVIYNIVNDLKLTEQWNDWNLRDTAMIITYGEKTVGQGAKTTWESAVMGNGSQEIIESQPYEKVKTALSFDGWSGTDHATFLMSPEGEMTNLSWSFESGEPLPFIMRGFLMLAGMKKSMKKSYRQGLNNIKQLAEKRANENVYGDYTIQLEDQPERNFVMSRKEVKLENVTQYYTSTLGPLFGKVQSAGVEMQGMPCGLFFRYDEAKGVADMAAGIPVSEPISIAGALSYSIDAQKAIVVNYYGDSQFTESAHEAIEAYMLDNGLLQDPPIMEEYLTDPSEESDPSKWLTKIVYYFSEEG